MVDQYIIQVHKIDKKVITYNLPSAWSYILVNILNGNWSGVLIKEVRTEMPSQRSCCISVQTHKRYKFIWPILKRAVQIHLRAIVQKFYSLWHRRRMQEMFHLWRMCRIWQKYVTKTCMQYSIHFHICNLYIKLFSTLGIC